MFRPITYITQLWSGLPKLVRFMSYHATWGMVLGCMVVFGVIWTDFALVARERFKDRRKPEREADEYFMACLWEHFADQPFERGNLDAGRLSWLFGREVVAAEEDFDHASYEAMLKIDEARARRAFPQVFQEAE